MGDIKNSPARPSGVLGLSDDELRALSQNATLRNHPTAMLVLSEGELSDGLYIILAGRVKVFLADDSGRELILNEQGPGECFGEMVLDDGPRTASVITLEPSRFLVVPRSDVGDFLQRHPEFAMQLIRGLISLVRRMTEKLKSMALQSVYERLVRLLYELAEAGGDGLAVRGRHTHADLARRIGASREMVTRLMKDLTTGGYLQVSEERIAIVRQLPTGW